MIILSLKKIIESNDEVVLYDEIISSFCCSKNLDVENFLKQKAINFEKSNKTRTFLVFDEVENLCAYFSLAVKIFELPLSTSKTLRKKVNGLSSNDSSGNPISSVPAYLIGQIAKNDVFSSKISGSDLLSAACKFIISAQNYVAGRVIMLECADTHKLREFYMANGFSLLEESTNPNNLLTYFKIIK